MADHADYVPHARVCEWPDCDERQAGLMRFCEHHGYRILMGHDPEERDHTVSEGQS